VDVLCPEEKVSDNERLHFYRGLATDAFLEEIFAEHHYDGIVNFIHYPDEKEYFRVHDFLMSHTDHLIFLSSYRVYANEQHPVTEDAPRLYDVIKDDAAFLSTEDYAVPKSKCEDFLRTAHAGEAWTIVRPVISFSQYRLDLLLYSGSEVLDYAASGKEMILPAMVKDYTAGIDWAGNSGKLIANLLFKTHTYGKTYTIYSGHGMTWGEVVDEYSALTGLKVRWVDDLDLFYEALPRITPDSYIWKYDRAFNRDIDASRVLDATGLSAADFKSVRDGIAIEIKKKQG
jgi:nucleoside-diphosphate-sugar epimerase